MNQKCRRNGEGRGRMIRRERKISAALDQQAAMSLDGLKDLLFKLELRRQAGTMSEAEYAAERARAEQILRDLVRG